MNKKIEELAEQCGFRPNPNIYDRNQSFDIEKFAELLIRECAKPVSNLYKQGGGTWGEVILKQFDLEVYKK
jgi:hypothetical protein